MTARAAQSGAVYMASPWIFCDSLRLATAPYYREARVTVERRQTACRMRHCCARRIVETGSRRKLGCSPTRSAERQRMIEAAANRIAMLTRQRRAQAVAFRRHKSHSSPRLPIKSLSLGVPKGPFSFAKENGPFDYAARRRHIPPRCARKILCSCYRRNLIFPQD